MQEPPSLDARRLCVAETTIAALYVLPKGPYFGLPGVDPWDETRDARKYEGPWPVVAHPPCERWGRYWFGGPSARVRREKGDDNGCFEAALSAVRRFGGVLEHPAASHAWSAFGLNRPPRSGGWIKADGYGWTCCVDQEYYGHRAQKATWLYAVVSRLPELTWGKGSQRIAQEYSSPEQRKRLIRTGVCQRMSGPQRKRTPDGFRDLLLGIARGARG